MQKTRELAFQSIQGTTKNLLLLMNTQMLVLLIVAPLLWTSIEITDIIYTLQLSILRIPCFALFENSYNHCTLISSEYVRL